MVKGGRLKASARAHDHWHKVGDGENSSNGEGQTKDKSSSKVVEAEVETEKRRLTMWKGRERKETMRQRSMGRRDENGRRWGSKSGWMERDEDSGRI